MTKVIRFDYTEFVKYYLKKTNIFVENKYFTSEEKEAYLCGVRNTLENLKEVLEKQCKRNKKLSVSSFNYELFLDSQQAEARKQSSKYMGTLEQQAYISAVHRTIAEVKCEIVKKWSKDGFVRDEDMKKPLGAMSLIWK